MALVKKTLVNQYEGMFLLPAGDVDAAIKLVRGIIEKHGGTIMVIKKWDERKLAYEMGPHKRGLYILAYFSGPGSIVVPIERDVTLSDNILRVLVTHADHMNIEEMNKVEPQPIQPREERPIWDRPYGDRPQRDDRGDRGDRGDRYDRPPSDRVTSDRPPSDRPTSDRPASDRPPRAPRKESAPLDAGPNKD
jgi:small subunit ribosomal protein S6